MRRQLATRLVLAVILFGACGPRVWDPSLGDARNVPTVSRPAYLKAHMHSGDVAVLWTWVNPNEGDETLQGVGTRYDPDRVQQIDGTLVIPFDSIALLESNDQKTVSRFAFSSLTTWTVLSGIVTIACVADPKSCFGSCPTFYLGDEDDRPVAEGFSSSFARTLEAVDLDALPERHGSTDQYSLIMRNEAPETHSVRSVRLRAVPRPSGSEVVVTGDGTFHVSLAKAAPTSCSSISGEGGSCADALRASDGQEYFSRSDSVDLAARETIEVEFDLPIGTDPGSRELALLIRARQSLMSTFLFYQSIAFLGENAGLWLAELERGDPGVREASLGLSEELGDIEVQLEYADGWKTVGRFGEAGPIAADTKVVLLGTDDERATRVRLRMARGLWRLDEVALVRCRARARFLVARSSIGRAPHGASGRRSGPRSPRRSRPIPRDATRGRLPHHLRSTR